MTDNYELDQRLSKLEGKAERRRMSADVALQMLRGLPFIAAGMILALFSPDHAATLAGIFLGLGGWLMIMLSWTGGK